MHTHLIALWCTEKESSPPKIIRTALVGAKEMVPLHTNTHSYTLTQTYTMREV